MCGNEARSPLGLPWVLETFHARFPVSVKSFGFNPGGGGGTLICKGRGCLSEILN